MNIKAAGKSDIGSVRKNNEDCILICCETIGILPNVFVVADGMGGHQAGEVASSSALSSFQRYIIETNENDGSGEILDTLTASIHYANQKVYRYSQEEQHLRGMGTTFTACSIADCRAYIAHVGDCRVYCLSGGTLNQLTTDHTYVNEMIRAGQLTRESAREHPNRNMLTRALGVENSLQVDGSICTLSPSDRLLICSDGLTAMLDDKELLELLGSSLPIEERVNILIEKANSNGGTDNISVILIDLV